jgi:hypothetical protein
MLALLLFACTSQTFDSGDPCAPSADPTLRIGQGEVQFDELTEGEPVELVYGPQGGWHAVMAIESTGMDMSAQLPAELTATLQGTLVMRSVPYVTLRCNSQAGAQQAWNLYLVVLETLANTDVHGQTVDVHVDLTDTRGTTVSADARIDLWDPTLE